MKDALQPGLTYELKYLVPEEKTVPHLYPEAPEFQVMPRVLASGFAVGLVERAVQAVNPHLDWPSEQTVGVGRNSPWRSRPRGAGVPREAQGVAFSCFFPRVKRI